MRARGLALALVAVGALAAPLDSGAALPIEGTMPSLAGATACINSPPLSPDESKGKVVLLDVWTYTCINWLRTEPYVRAWADKYKDHGLVVIGVHSPEFPFEHDVANVRRAAVDMRVTYPIAVDNDFAIWNALGNQYWPALYLVDAQGRIRYHQFGEGGFEETERAVQQLLLEAGRSGVPRDLVKVEGAGAEAPAAWKDLKSPENYVGYGRSESFASAGGALPDKSRVYEVPARLRLNQWALSGDWTITRGAVALNKANGRIAYRFHARDLHLVMGPAVGGKPVRFRVLVDGKPPQAAHGADVDDQGRGTVSAQRLYQLVRQPSQVGDRTFEIEFLDPGVVAYAFTFG